MTTKAWHERATAGGPHAAAAGRLFDARRGSWRELLPLLVLAALLAGVCRGHFVKPHADFYEFRETGHALLRGELPASFKRAPVFPVIVAAGERLLSAFGPTQTPPAQLAAGWLNALLLPASVGLAYLLGRGWFGEAARWTAAWTALLPIGLYCTGHVLAEPLLVATVLLTLCLAQRGSRLSYVAAALATLTRYDAAGLLVGVALADLLRGRSRKAVAWRTALAALPLGLWLTLTAATWETRAHDHYLRQIAERWSFDPVWPVRVSIDVVLARDALSLPIWAAQWEGTLRAAARAALIAATLLGAAALLRRRDGGAVAATAFAVGYLLVHAVFPFRAGFERFGWPTGMLVPLVAGCGLRVAVARVGPQLRSRTLRRVLLLLAGTLAVLLAGAEFRRLTALLNVRPTWPTALPGLALAGMGLVWLTGFERWRPLTGRLVVLAACALLAMTQGRQALLLLGDGRERSNNIAAARWIARNTQPADGVLCDEPGLLRMYVTDRPAERFVGFGGIAAETWPEILAECRRRGIRYIIWHDQVFAEQGAYYIRKWRLGRFAVLSEPDALPDVEVAARYRDRPNLWILRLLPTGER